MVINTGTDLWFCLCWMCVLFLISGTSLFFWSEWPMVEQAVSTCTGGWSSGRPPKKILFSYLYYPFTPTQPLQPYSPFQHSWVLLSLICLREVQWHIVKLVNSNCACTSSVLSLSFSLISFTLHPPYLPLSPCLPPQSCAKKFSVLMQSPLCWGI